MSICCVVGARPNFVKMAPVILELRRRKVNCEVVHTGQHYDASMSDIFFKDLGMPKPDTNLGVGSFPTQGEQVAAIMIAFEAYCLKNNPSLVIVGGDVNSTFACAFAASRLEIPVAHVESGLRSMDLSMPEETNRILTDHLSEFLFTTEPSGKKNLLQEGVAEKKIFYVGNTMIDSLKLHLEKANSLKAWENYGVKEKEYVLVTLHRPSNVNHQNVFKEIMSALKKAATRIPVLFPMHPRTKKAAQEYQLDSEGIQCIEPKGYIEFLSLMASARCVITDSGGIQEETTALGVSCLTLRLNTERPITVDQGSNRLVGLSEGEILKCLDEVLVSKPSKFPMPERWEGQASKRIVEVLQANGF